MPLKDPVARRAYLKAYRAKNHERMDKVSRDWRKIQGPWYQAGAWMKCVYGIDMAEYTRMFDAQGGRCAICGATPKPSKGRIRPLHIDHDHVTGRVRGLLCNKCNVWLHVLERPDWMEKARQYLHGMSGVLSNQLPSVVAPDIDRRLRHVR